MAIDARDVARSIENWFKIHARDLPWRRRRTRWRSFVSEIMLQQTQVARVEERFEDFMELFPTPRALAEAPPDLVTGAWAGLGYYRRARNLHAAAKQIVEKHGGRVPASMEALLVLPGIGRYTAGAIASIACGKAEPIVDGNVHRVLSRLYADEVSLDDREGAKRCWDRAARLVEAAASPAALNEGLMELGSQVCTKQSASCQRCPVRKWCQARKQGRVDAIPPARHRGQKVTEHHHAVGIIRRGKLVLQRRSTEGRWAGLWQMPTIEAGRRLGPSEITRRLELRVEGLQHLGSFERVLTHRRIRFHVFKADLAKGQRLGGANRWVPRGGSVPLGVAQKRTLEVLDWA